RPPATREPARDAAVSAARADEAGPSPESSLLAVLAHLSIARAEAKVRQANAAAAEIRTALSLIEPAPEVPPPPPPPRAPTTTPAPPRRTGPPGEPARAPAEIGDARQALQLAAPRVSARGRDEAYSRIARAQAGSADARGAEETIGRIGDPAQRRV